MQHRRFHARGLAVHVERIADRVQRLVVLATHLLGQELQLALVRAVRRDPTGLVDVGDEALGHGQLRHLLGGHFGQLPRQIEHFKGLPPLLAAAGGQELTGFGIFSTHSGHRIKH